MRRIITIWLLLLAVAFGCATPPVLAVELAFGGEQGPVADEADLQQGIDLYAAGEPDEALLLLRGFVVRHQDSPLLPRAYLYLARIFLDRDRHDEALLYLERIPAQQRGPEVQLVFGASLVAAGEIEEGSALLRPLEEVPLAEADQALRLAFLAEGDARLGRSLQALALLHRGISLPDSGRQADNLWRLAHSLLSEHLDNEALAEAAFMLRGTALGKDAVLQQALRAQGRGDEAAARQLVEAVVAGPPSFPYRDQAVALWEQLTGNVWLQRSIGVLLPQSGRYASFGQLVRRGMELARQIHAESRPPVRFLFRDSGAEPERSAQAVSELANAERVMAIAGPLTGSAASAAAARAQQERVPLLALSQREGLPETGAFVFRNSLTARLQAQALARHAVEERGMTAFGVLYPENRLGRELAELFAAEVLLRGGLVVAQEGYAEDATDFGRQIKLLKGEDPDAPAEEEPVLTEEERLEDLFVPDAPEFPAVDFDALFIPDYAERVGLIAPQLVYYGIEDLPLLGINGWNSPELIRIGGAFVEGAVFVDGFFRYSPYPFVEEFVNRYFEQYGEEPSILEAQGFDVANILFSLIDRPEVTSRESLRLALAQLKNYPGVTGGTTFNLLGDAEKVLFLLRVENGNIVQIN